MDKTIEQIMKDHPNARLWNDEKGKFYRYIRFTVDGVLMIAIHFLGSDAIEYFEMKGAERIG